MGCWGITALESDTGLDVIEMIRDNITEDQRLDMDQALHILKADFSECIPDVKRGIPHTGPMMILEVICMYLDGRCRSIDWPWEPTNRCFSELTSLSISKKTLQEISGYLRETLLYSRENARNPDGRKWNGWIHEKDWKAWQSYMEALIERVNALMDLAGDPIEFVQNNLQLNHQTQ